LELFEQKNVMHNIGGNKNELALRAFNANQVIYGANSSVDDDVKYDKDIQRKICLRVNNLFSIEV
jgi:hypothetical protein